MQTMGWVRVKGRVRGRVEISSDAVQLMGWVIGLRSGSGWEDL